MGWEQQREMATALGQFLQFASPPGAPANIELVTSTNALQTYVDALCQRKLRPGVIISKIKALCIAPKFVLHQ